MFRRFLAGSAIGLTLLSAPAFAADNMTVKDSTGATVTLRCKDVGSGVQACVNVPFDSAGNDATDTTNHSVKVTTVAATDYRPASGPITAADSATTTVAGQSGVTLVTGSPTASSFQTWALNGHSSATLTVTGTFVATAQIETSADGGTTYAPASAKILGASIVSSSITAPGVFRLDVTGMTNVRVRASAYTSGTMTVQLAASSSAGLSQVINPVRLTDGAGNGATFNADGSLTARLAPISSWIAPTATAAMTGTTPTQMFPAPGAGLRNVVTHIICPNSSSTVGTLVDVTDGNGGTVLAVLAAGINYGGTSIAPPTFRQPTANTALYVADETTGASVKCSASGYTTNQ